MRVDIGITWHAKRIKIFRCEISVDHVGDELDRITFIPERFILLIISS